MQYKFFKNQLSKLRAENALLKFFIIVIGLSNIFFGMFSYKAVKQKEIVIVPVGYNKKIEVGNKIDEMYILEMTRFIADSLLNYTPATIKNQYEIILSLMDPSVYPKYKEIFEKFINDVILTKISSSFFIRKIEHDPTHHLVKITGEKISILNGQVVERKIKVYGLTYKIKYGKFTITRWGIFNMFNKNKEKKGEKND